MKYAVKSILRDKLDKDPEEREMLEQELHILMEVDHPNIVKFYESYCDSKYYRIVMEYCEGGDLFDHLKERTRFSEKEGVIIVQQLLSAIKYLHDLNIAHRDLKPENVIFVGGNEGNVKLIDFGLSKIQAFEGKQ